MVMFGNINKIIDMLDLMKKLKKVMDDNGIQL